MTTIPASNFSNAYANLFQQGMEYWIDAAQRSALYMDAMRKRGNMYIECSVQGKPPLLTAVAALVANARRAAADKTIG